MGIGFNKSRTSPRLPETQTDTNFARSRRAEISTFDSHTTKRSTTLRELKQKHPGLSPSYFCPPPTLSLNLLFLQRQCVLWPCWPQLSLLVIHMNTPANPIWRTVSAGVWLAASMFLRFSDARCFSVYRSSTTCNGQCLLFKPSLTYFSNDLPNAR